MGGSVILGCSAIALLDNHGLWLVVAEIGGGMPFCGDHFALSQEPLSKANLLNTWDF